MNNSIAAGCEETDGRRDGGFTLLEVLVALAILSLTLVVLLGLRNRDVILVDQTRQITVATALARVKMVEAEMEGFPELGESAGDFGEEHPGFLWRRTVSFTPFDYVREIQIAIAWGTGGRESVELISYVFEDEVK